MTNDKGQMTAAAATPALKPLRLSAQEIIALGNTMPNIVPARGISSGKEWKALYLMPACAVPVEIKAWDREELVGYVSAGHDETPFQITPPYRPGDLCYIEEDVDVLALYAGVNAIQLGYKADQDSRTVFLPEGMAMPRLGSLSGPFPQSFARMERIRIGAVSWLYLHKLTEEDARLTGAVAENPTGRSSLKYSYVAGYRGIWNELFGVKQPWRGGNWLCWRIEIERVWE